MNEHIRYELHRVEMRGADIVQPKMIHDKRGKAGEKRLAEPNNQIDYDKIFRDWWYGSHESIETVSKHVAKLTNLSEYMKFGVGVILLKKLKNGKKDEKRWEKWDDWAFKFRVWGITRRETKKYKGNE